MNNPSRVGPCTLTEDFFEKMCGTSKTLLEPSVPKMGEFIIRPFVDTNTSEMKDFLWLCYRTKPHSCMLHFSRTLFRLVQENNQVFFELFNGEDIETSTHSLKFPTFKSMIQSFYAMKKLGVYQKKNPLWKVDLIEQLG